MDLENFDTSDFRKTLEKSDIDLNKELNKIDEFRPSFEEQAEKMKAQITSSNEQSDEEKVDALINDLKSVNKYTARRLLSVELAKRKANAHTSTVKSKDVLKRRAKNKLASKQRRK